MNTRMQSALTKPAAGGRSARMKRQAPTADVGELFLAELADRRARLQELLGLIRSEVAREMALEQPRRMACRRAPSLREPVALRTARAN
jgi:hypothetical protein